LSGSDLSGSDLSGSNLRGSNLREAGILSLGETPSGAALLYPTPDGWHMQVGCWRGSPDELRALATDFEREWPDANTVELKQFRSKYLLAILAHVDLVTEEKAHLIVELAAKWGTTVASLSETVAASA